MIKIKNETELNVAVKAFEEYGAAIEEYHRKKLEFEVGQSYAWRPDKVAHRQGKRHGPLKCVYIGTYQGLFTDNAFSAGAFENNNGLHVIATAHLKSGELVKVS